MSASGLYGPTRACAGIISYVDMTLGARARDVLEAHVAAGNGRFRGIRHSGGWDPSPDVRNAHTNPPQGLYAEADYRAGVAELGKLGLTYEAWQYHPQVKEVTALAKRRAGHHHDFQPLRRAAGHRAVCRQDRCGVRDLEGRHRRAGALPQCRGEAGRARHGYRPVRSTT